MPLPASLDTLNWTTSLIADACAALHVPVRLGPPGLVPLVREWRVAGVVAPVVHAGSPELIREAIAGAARGHVLVVDNNGRLDEGCIGRALAADAAAAGLAGVVLDGAHCDGAALRVLALPLWSRGACPARPHEVRRPHATALQAATCGSTTVTREDAVFADEDGVVFVALVDCARVISRAHEMAGSVV